MFAHPRPHLRMLATGLAALGAADNRTNRPVRIRRGLRNCYYFFSSDSVMHSSFYILGDLSGLTVVSATTNAVAILMSMMGKSTVNR